MVPILVLLPLAYLLGTFPSALLVARGKGVDVTAEGSGNPGASNVGRLLGRRAGIVVFVLDALKGAICAGVGLAIGGYAGGLALGGAAILGHIFPVTRRFRGGKGVATGAGVIIVLYPLISLVLAVVWIVTLKLSHKASVASLAIIAGLPIAMVVAGRPWQEIAAVVALAAVVVSRHADNLRRLVRGDELGVRTSDHH
jgi:glycerol-3-phosphate acyltransferase PlsY